jgi:hypothetical protein
MEAELDPKPVSVGAQPAADRFHDSERRFANWLAFAFFVVVALTMLRHEMWRDELEAFWRRATALPPLMSSATRATTGTPSPGTCCCTRRRTSHTTRAGCNCCTRASRRSARTCWRASPRSRGLQRALLCFGYFPLFEYGVISREYVLGVVMLFAFCAAYGAGAGVVVLALLAGLLAQTSAYGLMISMALVAAVAVVRLLPRSMGVPLMHGRDGHATWIALLIYVASVGLGVVQLIPPTDTGTVVGWGLPSWNMFPLVIIWRAIVPVPPSRSALLEREHRRRETSTRRRSGCCCGR